MNTFNLGHRAPVYAVKFGLNSNNLCSVSNDRTLKLWDAGERAYIDTLYTNYQYYIVLGIGVI